MFLEFFLAISAFGFVAGITPGPNNAMILSASLTYGLHRILPHLMGIVIGFGFMLFMMGLGLLSLLELFPLLYKALHIVAVIYLLYLAWKIATATPVNNVQNAKRKPMTFLQAFAFQWVNPKAWVMVTAAITTYIPDVTGKVYLLYLGFMAVYYSFITLICTGTWAAAGHAFRQLLKHPIYYRIFNFSMAALLILSLYPLFEEIKHWFD